ncbi:hypothetical protein [Amycolatopsis magusensis]|uniref:hypothetical protein n=1 Tax=Amycolatopsis magusensis TaxID=882444 RepID=UPI00378C016D
MRATRVILFFRLLGAVGVGTYIGLAAAGMLAVLTGRVFVPGSTWTTALPLLIPLGALLTAGATRLTRFWLLPKLRSRRALAGAAAGAILTPLAVAFSQLGDLTSVGLLPPAIGAVITAALWVRWHTSARSGRKAPRGLAHPLAGQQLSRTR